MYSIRILKKMTNRCLSDNCVTQVSWFASFAGEISTVELFDSTVKKIDLGMDEEDESRPLTSSAVLVFEAAIELMGIILINGDLVESTQGAADVDAAGSDDDDDEIFIRMAAQSLSSRSGMTTEIGYSNV